MPLVRFPVRNEYGLCQPELYKEANKEDPKAVLEDVAVAGLVGILRQLGDLAEFAAEVFHGLQEQVMATASRSHKLMVHVQCIEAALPPLEKAVLAQTSHIHFAYTAGSEWRPCIPNVQTHFIDIDWPRFIMDSYEECRNPPRLHLLEKFDAGGPGSCLKRYSDPTFFKRVSGNSIEGTCEKIRRDKKARKSKKKRSSQRNGQISRVASISNQSQSGRMHLTSLTANGQTSSQTASKVEMTLKSDLHDRSSSFDSRNGLGYIECVFNLGSSLQPGEQGSMESSSRLMQEIDTLDPVFSDEPTQMVDNSFPHSSSPGGIALHSSCVTWDEKAEVVEPKIQQCDRSEASESLSANFGIDAPDRETANLRNVDQMDVLLDREVPEVLSANFDIETPDRETVIPGSVDQMDILPTDEDITKSISSGNQLDEIEIEIDNYMDAHNTIESESENDGDCQTKQEVEQYSPSVNNDRIEDGIEESMAHSSDPHPSNIESHAVSSISSGNGMSCRLPESVPSESITHEQTPQISGKSFDPDHSPGTDIFASADILDRSKVEPVVNDGPSIVSVISDPSSSGSIFSGLHDQSSVRYTNNFGEAQQSHAEFSSVQSVKIWTNGGLLGLEPSKPPDFAVSNTTGWNDVSRSKFDPPNTALKVDGQKEKLDILVENAESSEMVSSCSVDKVPVPLAVADSKLVKSNGSHNSNRFNHGLGGGLKVTAMPTSGTELPPDVKTSSTEANQENDGNSSLLYGLGHRLLVNGFRRKLSLVHDDKSEPVSCLETGVFDWERRYNHDAYQTMAEMTFMEQFGHVSPLCSLTSSPPLEHMKISFKPADGFDTSKLNLKFPDGSQCPESIRDMFTSFQLVPEPAIPSHYCGSDSDADTFCRSSPYISDDCRSHHSESNSEKWESSPRGSNEHELYDALCQMSTMEYISSSLQVERAVKNGMHADHGLQSMHTENDADPCLSVLDLPSFDSMNLVVQGETKTDSDSKNLSKLLNNTHPTPLPPPLPPMQWWVSKSNSDVAEDEQYNESDSPRRALNQKLLGSSMSQQPEPAPANQQLTDKDSVAFRRESKREDHQKLNGKKEVNHNATGKGMDEKEDILNQIGSKSFSLRPTVAARATFSSGPAANHKVTAILEKATAIRQAVASDDGEDEDSRSET